MKFRKLIFGSAVLLALTASFAFTAEKRQFLISASIINPLRSTECDSFIPADDDCNPANTGARCTYYYSATYPAVPEFSNGTPHCTYPLYHQF